MWSGDENRGNLTRGDAISSAFEDKQKNKKSSLSGRSGEKDVLGIASSAETYFS